MKLQAFIDSVAELTRSGRVRWHLDGPCITSDDELCPLHEVALRHLGEFDDVTREARRLGLSPAACDCIIHAADGGEAHDAEVRRLLLVACGLAPPADETGGE